MTNKIAAFNYFVEIFDNKTLDERDISNLGINIICSILFDESISQEQQEDNYDILLTKISEWRKIKLRGRLN